MADKKLHFIFVCAGNICRSPFAEQYARLKFPQLNFESFGVHVTWPEKSPPDALKAAQKFGIDLSQHTAKDFLQMPPPKDVALYLAMDKQNLIRLGKYFQLPSQKVVLLDHPSEIEDPWQCGSDFYDKVYRQITKAIDNKFKNEQ